MRNMRNVSLNPDHRIARLRSLQTIWDVLYDYQDIAKHMQADHWDDICEAMDVIHKVIGIEQEDI